MDFIDEIQSFAKTVPERTEKILTEEGTKNALIMPFIKILGYDVFDPNEVNPEYNADIGTKKGEKVDYAIMKDNEPIMLIECKTVNADLNVEHASQLFRYFTVTPARIGVLTNGIVYQFFTDLESPNKMDDKPFLEINLLDIKEPLIAELKKFTKPAFNIEEIDTNASQLKYTKEMINILNKEFSDPSEEFVKLLAKQVYSKVLTQQAKEKFAIITHEATSQFLNEKINERLKSAMMYKAASQIPTPADTIQPSDDEQSNEITTTEEEWHAYYMIQAILHEIVTPNRVSIRDAKSYCAILLDDNNRKPICRLNFNSKEKAYRFLITIQKNNK